MSHREQLLSTSSSRRHDASLTFVVCVGTAAAAAALSTGYYYYYYYYHHNYTHSQHQDSGLPNSEQETTITLNGTTANSDSSPHVAPPPVDSIDCSTTTTTTMGHATTRTTNRHNQVQRRILSPNTITIVHGSITGTCLKFAQELYQDLLQQQQEEAAQFKSPLSTWRTKTGITGSSTIHVQMGCIQDYDWWDELINEDEEEEAEETAQRNTSTTSKTSPATLIVLLPTYTNGTFTPNSTNLQEALQEIQTDWRISQQPLNGDQLQVAVFGAGSSEYNDPVGTTTTTTSTTTTSITSNNMGQPAKMAIRAFHKLGAKVLTKLMIGDDAVGDHMVTTFQDWKTKVLQELFHPSPKKNVLQQLRPKKQFSTLPNTPSAVPVTTTTTTKATTTTAHPSCESQTTNATNDTTTTTTNSCGCTTTTASGGCCQTTSATTEEHHNCTTNNTVDPDNDENVDDGDDYDDDYDDDDDEEEEGDDNAEPEVMDLEDIGDAIHQSETTTTTASHQEPREMVTPSQAVALKKEGYKLIGTHSAVKLCRWTKHQLRGRGGCYKHTFYGITSYQCMEATPSLACANKCVFCWRHHKNPVGKEWRWKTDDPYYIVDEAVQTHIHMIKETRGIPGVQLDRWKEAHTVRHCALSLVGEPIMYPRIDELLGELHRRQISTFLVTNGQHPTAIGSIRPITQLYVSVDAPTEQSLIAIDRPLFQDAWDRLRLSLSSLKDKGQRTVARLTVVKGWNSDEISGYAELIAMGQVSLVEVKGVTFCGKSDASNLNMTNTPWHHEVVDLTRTLMNELNEMRRTDPTIPEYDLACEHKHSCSVLLARVDQFATEGYDTQTGQRKWRTWIDYDKFQALAAQHQADPTCTFSVVDYTAPTPDWAIFGAKEEGFDPTDRRHRKQTKHPMYTQYDSDGIPTHDADDHALLESERQRLRSVMEERKRQIGDGSTVTELRGGEKEVLDASLMFRGLVVTK